MGCQACATNRVWAGDGSQSSLYGGKHYANKLHPLTFFLYRDILNICLTSDYMYAIFILLLIECIGMRLCVGLCK